MRISFLPFFALLAACTNCHNDGKRPPAVGSVASAAPADPVPAPAPAEDRTWLPTPFDEDPRIAPARQKLLADPSAAVAALPDPAGFTPADACMLHYLKGQWLLRAGDPRGAATAFQAAQAADATAPLGHWPTLRAAQALLTVKDFAAAKPLALAAREEGRLGKSPEALVAAIDATLGASDTAAARPLLEEYVKTAPKGPRAGAVSLALARLLVADSPKDACALVRKTILEKPGDARREDAEKLLRDIPACAANFSAEERVARLEAFAEVDGKAAARDAESALKEHGYDDGQTCRLLAVRARGEGKKGKDAGDAWLRAADGCAANERAKALWNAGKAYSAAKLTDAAATAYARVESEHKSSSLADDARLKRALILADSGQAAPAEDLLASIATDFPDGDMAQDALFRAALAKMDRKEDASAKPLLTKIVELEARGAKNRNWSSRGRARYFLARLAEVAGDREAALAGYEAVLATDPLAYYMLLAHARLAALAPERAAAALAAGNALAEKIVVPPLAAPLRDAPNVRRALALLRVGEGGPAKSAIGEEGKFAEDAALWAHVAPAFAAGGAADVAHNPFRGKFLEKLDAYPSGAERLYWEAAFPRPFAQKVKAEAALRGVSQALVYGVMREESTFVRDIKSPTGAVGLLQLMPDTAKTVARGTDYSPDPKALVDPDTNIPLGTKLLGELQVRYQQRFPLSAGGYNAGPGAVDRWLRNQGQLPFDLWVETIPYDETRGYIKRVIASMGAYAWLYEPEALPELLRIPLDLPSQAAAKL